MAGATLRSFGWMHSAALALGLLMLTGCATTKPAEPARLDFGPPPWAVVIVPFDVSDLPADKQWIGEGIAQIVSLGLVQHPTIVQIERSRVTTIPPDVWTEPRVREAVRSVQAHAAVYGRVTRQGDELVVQPVLLDARTGRTRSLTPMTFVERDFLTRIAALPALYAREIAPQLDENVAARIEKAARPTASLPAFRLFALGEREFDRGNPEAAVDSIARALEADPRFVIGHYRLGIVHVGLRSRWKAAAQFRAALQLDPSMPEPYKAIGDLFLAAPRGLFEQAIEAYTRAIEFRPFYADAWGGLGDARAAKGDVDGATAAYRKAQTLDPFNPATRFKLEKLAGKS